MNKLTMRLSQIAIDGAYKKFCVDFALMEKIDAVCAVKRNEFGNLSYEVEKLKAITEATGQSVYYAHENYSACVVMSWQAATNPERNDEWVIQGWYAQRIECKLNDQAQKTVNAIRAVFKKHGISDTAGPQEVIRACMASGIPVVEYVRHNSLHCAHAEVSEPTAHKIFDVGNDAHTVAA